MQNLENLTIKELNELVPYLTPRERKELEEIFLSNRVLTFHEWIDKAKPKFRWYKHCEVLCDVLQRVADGKLKRVMIFMPRRLGKSEMASRLLPGYFLYRYPHYDVGLTSYSGDLAQTLSRSARDHYVAGGGALSKVSSAVEHWNTTMGGGMWCAGRGGTLTGKGWHLGIVDDILKGDEEARSLAIREHMKEWYQSTFYSGEEPWSDTDATGALVLIGTRWHEDDLSGWQLTQAADESDDEEDDRESTSSAEKWHIVNLEAIKEETSQVFPVSCTLEPDWRQPGESICPERRPVWKLEKIKHRVGTYFWNAIYQQHPTPGEGLFFKVNQIEIIPAEPAGLVKCRAWDFAATDKDGDFTAGVLMGKSVEGYYYVLDVVREQVNTDDRERLIKQTAALDGFEVSIHGPQDPGSAGKDVRQYFIRMLAGYPVKVETVSGSKQSRAQSFAAQLNVGNVKVISGKWNRAFIDELRSFPLSQKDDQVDASSDGFNELALSAQFISSTPQITVLPTLDIAENRTGMILPDAYPGGLYTPPGLGEYQ